MNFSIVCPINNEVNLIPFTLPSLYNAHPDEVILCLDKSSPKNVLNVIKKVAEAHNAVSITKIIEIERNSEYRFHQAWVRRCGFRASSNDVILTLDIDTMLNPKVTKYIPYVGMGNIRLVSFSKFGYPILSRYNIAWLIHRFYHHHSFTGIYAFSRNAWLETEDEESLKKIRRGEDTHLHGALTKVYDDIFISDIKNIVLRPDESGRYQYMMGFNRWKMRHTSFLRVLISSILYFRPHMLIGYINARWSAQND